MAKKYVSKAKTTKSKSTTKKYTPKSKVVVGDVKAITKAINKPANPTMNYDHPEYFM